MQCHWGRGLDIDFILFLYRFESDKLDTIAEDARACICTASRHLIINALPLYMCL